MAEHAKGTWVRGLVENTNDQGAEFSWLKDNGLPVQDHPNPAYLHHKYVVLDAGYPWADPTVVTGSHNWTQAAESDNDENTLIIHDADIATLFQAEFERRWAETGTATVDLAGQKFTIFPNPTMGQVFIRQTDDALWNGLIEIWDANGQLLKSIRHDGPRAILDLQTQPPGNYFIFLKTENGSGSFPIQTISH